MPCCRHQSTAFVPASAGWRMPIICSSVNRFACIYVPFLSNKGTLAHAGLISGGNVTGSLPRTPLIVHNGKNRKHIAVTRASSEPSLHIYGCVFLVKVDKTAWQQEFRCEAAPIGYLIGEPQKDNLSDTSSWLFSFKGREAREQEPVRCDGGE
jgi:hypothetical protein